MSGLKGLLYSLVLFSFNVFAIEPVMEHQGMFYIDLSFDAGYPLKTDHDLGFRFDRGLVEPGQTMSIGQLAAQPAVFNLKLNQNGIKAFELHGIDYSYEEYVYSGAEGGDAGTGAANTTNAETGRTETTAEAERQTKTKIEIPLGVVIGVLIGATALAN